MPYKRRFTHQKMGLHNGLQNMPWVDAKRLTNDQFIDPPGHLENHGQGAMILKKKNENSNIAKIKTQTPNKWPIYPPKTGPRNGPQKMPRNDTKRLTNDRFIGHSEHLENRGHGTMIL